MAVDYDQDAEEYARHRGTHPGVVAALAGAVDGAVLEVGCGTGNYLAALRTMTDAAFHGVEPSPAMLAKARARLPDQHLVRASAEAMPFADATFGLVYSVDVIHHVADIPCHMAEAARVLRPGGRLCVVTDSADDIRAREPLSRYFPETVDIELARYPSVASLHDAMAAAGLSVLPTTQVRRTYRLTSAQAFRDRAFSSLHLLPDDVFRRRVGEMEAALALGPIPALSLYTLLWARRS